MCVCASCKTLKFEAILVVEYLKENAFLKKSRKCFDRLFMALRRTLPQVDSPPVNSLVRVEMLSLYNGYQITIEH